MLDLNDQTLNPSAEVLAFAGARGSSVRFRVPRNILLAGEILAIYLRVRLLLVRHDAPETVRRLRQGPVVGRPSRGARAPLREQASHLARATVLVLDHLPIDSRCLLRSFVLARLMTRRALSYEIVFSVRGGDGFEAHCWVETDGVPMLLPGGADHAVVMRL